MCPFSPGSWLHRTQAKRTVAIIRVQRKDGQILWERGRVTVLGDEIASETVPEAWADSSTVGARHCSQRFWTRLQRPCWKCGWGHAMISLKTKKRISSLAWGITIFRHRQWHTGSLEAGDRRQTHEFIKLFGRGSDGGLNGSERGHPSERVTCFPLSVHKYGGMLRHCAPNNI